MKKIIFLLSLLLLNTCSKELIQPANTPSAVFAAASTYIEETYSMLELKNWIGPVFIVSTKAKSRTI